MSKDRREYTEYVADVFNNIKRSDKNYSDDDISNIIKRVDKTFNDIDYHFPRKGWKYLCKHYTPELKRGENVWFGNLCESYDNFAANPLALKFYPCHYMCTVNSDGEYTVTFSFRRRSDAPEHDFKKYLVYNYFKEKYTYKNISAMNYKTAVSIAYNNNRKSFPTFHNTERVSVGISKIDFKPVYVKRPDGVKNPFIHGCPDYKRIKHQMMDVYNLTDKDIRFYTSRNFGAVVVRRPSKERVNAYDYDVAFSFVNPIDLCYLDELQNKGLLKNIYKYHLIKNYMTGTYFYTIRDVIYNSMEAVVEAFNSNRFSFPKKYHDQNLSILLNVHHDLS